MSFFIDVPPLRSWKTLRSASSTPPLTPDTCVQSSDDEESRALNVEADRELQHVRDLRDAMESLFTKFSSTNIDPALVTNIRQSLDTRKRQLEFLHPVEPTRATPLDDLWDARVQAPGDAAWTSFVVDGKCGRIIRDILGIPKLRPFQAQAIMHGLKGKDVVVIAPTGSGKSLVFQSLALYDSINSGKVTVVISPLRSLIVDQKRELLAKDVDVVTFLAREQVENWMDTDDLPAIAYMTPEKLKKAADMPELLRAWHANGLLARIVIDEGHCLTTARFRGDAFFEPYNLLASTFSDVPVLVLTGSATPQVVSDIQMHLLPPPTRSSPHHPKPTKLLPHRPSETDQRNTGVQITGIIYCTTRRGCERLAKRLRKQGHTAVHYHSDMSEKEKDMHQELWSSGECLIMVATISFGMGINQKDARWVIHFDFPKSIVNLDQEAGRPGRDGGPAHCIIFYSYIDLQIILSLIHNDKDLTADDVTAAKRDALEVVEFCEDRTTCRRTLLLRHLGERYTGDCSGTCSVCMNAERLVSGDYAQVAQDARTLLRAVLPQRITVQQFVELFRGRKTSAAKEKDKGWRAERLYGAGREIPVELVELLVVEMIRREVFVVASVQVTGREWWNRYLQFGKRAQAPLDDFVLEYHTSQRLPRARWCRD
ncbi:ATP-dependent DNA helicase [Mycena kentingensis (nom. inval.)]|nr:ATP-dependent DNA helicase [Mycena kentingensis (nom. inval.)]